MEKSRYNSRLLKVLLVALLFFIACFPLGNISPYGGSSEAREAHVARVIYETGEKVLPLRNGLVPSKPPLHHWLSASVAHLRGKISEINVRIPSTVLGILILVLTFFSASAVGQSTGHGLAAVFMLVSTYGFLPLLFDGRVDVTCSFFVLTAAFLLLRRLEQDGISSVTSWDLCCFFIFSGMATLAKGPLGLVLPVVAVFSAFTWHSGLKQTAIRFVKPHYSWLLYLFIAVPWYYLASVRGGEGFVDRQLVFENIKRFAGGEQMNTEAWWYYFPSFLRQALPWSVLFIIAVISDIRRYLGIRSDLVLGSGTEARALRLRLAWAVSFISCFVFFSVAAGKRHSYLFPLFPLMSVFLAGSLLEKISSLGNRVVVRFTDAADRLSRAAFFVAAFMLVFLLLNQLLGLPAGIAAQARYGRAIAYISAWLSSVSPYLEWTLFAGCLFWLTGEILSGSHRKVRGVFVFACAFAVLLELSLGVKNTLKGFDEIALKINAATDPAETIAIVRDRPDEYFDPVMYYLGRNARLVPSQASGFECMGPGTSYVAKAAFVGELKKQDGIKIVEIARYRERDDELLGRNRGEVSLFRCEK